MLCFWSKRVFRNWLLVIDEITWSRSLTISAIESLETVVDTSFSAAQHLLVAYKNLLHKYESDGLNTFSTKYQTLKMRNIALRKITSISTNVNVLAIMYMIWLQTLKLRFLNRTQNKLLNCQWYKYIAPL